jgi:hypothetical protein
VSGLIVNRLEPAQLKSYVVSRPHATHTRIASCHEISCERELKGWRMVLNLVNREQRDAAKWIKYHSGRHFTVEAQEGDMVTLRFAPGQQCFETHRVALERDPVFYLREGDRRGNPRGTPAQRLNGADWQDSFSNHQQTLADAAQRG